MKKKRITVEVVPEIDKIKTKIHQDTGVTMTYVQLINFLIHFYIKHANEPKTKWSSLQ